MKSKAIGTGGALALVVMLGAGSAACSDSPLGPCEFTTEVVTTVGISDRDEGERLVNGSPASCELLYRTADKTTTINNHDGTQTTVIEWGTETWNCTVCAGARE